MKNGVECYKDFFPYFKALKTNCEDHQQIYDLQKNPLNDESLELIVVI